MRRVPLTCALLVAATLAVYGQALSFEFVSFDDGAFVTDVPAVRGGLTLDGVLWAFSERHVVVWQPVTWLSHMLDWQLFGADPAGHHATSVILHALNALLLFGALRSLTGRDGRSAVVAALFALHPLHVESVAWVAERKDVLSTCFGLMSLWAWARYARDGSRQHYAVAGFTLLLGLLAKPMLVTWPLLFLLLDHWPLGRLASRRELPSRLLEKLPLFALCGAVALVTLWSQQGAMQAGAALPLQSRLANAALACAAYLGKTLWPAGLSVLYPHPYIPGTGGVPPTPWTVALCAVLAIALSCAALRGPRYARVGWLWFLIALLPTLGLVQVGTQAMADRYTYVPLVGIFVAGVWAAADALERLAPGRSRLAATLSGVTLGALAAVSFAQARHWRDSASLFEHALAVTPTNATAWVNLGVAYESRGRLADAADAYRSALAVHPTLLPAHFNLANALRASGQLEGAVRHYARALEIAPDDARVANNLAGTLRMLGHRDQAESLFGQVVARQPGNAIALVNLATLYHERGELDRAIDHYQRALAVEPELPGAGQRLARARAQQRAHAGQSGAP